jgi:phage terminase small subunit
MAVLKNQKWERFCQEIANGKTGDEAYVLAGYKENRHNASRLKTSETIAKRVDEILGKAANKVGISIERVLSELALIGFANMADYMRAGGDGDPYLDFSKLTRAQAAALAEVTVEDFKEGRGKTVRDVRRIKFKLADKRAALIDIGRHLGMFKDKIEVSGAVGIYDATKLQHLSDAEITTFAAILARLTQESSSSVNDSGGNSAAGGSKD